MALITVFGPEFVRCCYGVLRCHAVSYVVVRCFKAVWSHAVFGPFSGPCVVRCSYVVDTARDIRLALLYMIRCGHGPPTRVASFA
jgi:hypothetical protein